MHKYDKGVVEFKISRHLCVFGIPKNYKGFILLDRKLKRFITYFNGINGCYKIKDNNYKKLEDALSKSIYLLSPKLYDEDLLKRLIIVLIECMKDSVEDEEFINNLNLNKANYKNYSIIIPVK